MCFFEALHAETRVSSASVPATTLITVISLGNVRATPSTIRGRGRSRNIFFLPATIFVPRRRKALRIALNDAWLPSPDPYEFVSPDLETIS
jgi:hypothetical protein